MAWFFSPHERYNTAFSNSPVQSLIQSKNSKLLFKETWPIALIKIGFRRKLVQINGWHDKKVGETVKLSDVKFPQIASFDIW